MRTNPFKKQFKGMDKIDHLYVREFHMCGRHEFYESFKWILDHSKIEKELKIQIKGKPFEYLNNGILIFN